MKKFRLMLVMVACLTLLCACGKKGDDVEITVKSTATPKPTEAPVEATPEATATPAPTATPRPTATPKPTATPLPAPKAIYVDFKGGNSNLDVCEISNGWSNGGNFNVIWRKKNCEFINDVLKMTIQVDNGGKLPYSGGEYRTRAFCGYGRYEVSMKAIKNDGVVTSYFTYTGPTDKQPWDEIDVEILGKDTTKVQFNYYTNGKGNHEYMYDLGFDASEDFHTYAFEWYEDKIVWFVDGVEAYTATTNIPTHRSRIMMNVWCGKGVDSWLKRFDDSNIPISAEYAWFSYTPFE